MNRQNNDPRSTVELFSKVFIVYGIYDVVRFVWEYQTGRMVSSEGAAYPGWAAVACGAFAAVLAVLKIVTGILGLQQVQGKKVNAHITLATVALVFQMVTLICSVFGWGPVPNLGVTDMAISLAVVLSLVMFTKYAKFLNK